ncbi:hypothetical protein GCM10023114_36760 [Mycolicibacterium sediminis]|uniref:DUF998 domain-containing protein n=1 Tax=Mycolicibacterium sediminis TaxID=1286180 RepID=A0A7I7QWF9_9MYCO|nr:hypothetical protein MSEDJ_48150 [Mycolicibacterium sediminis]
MCTLAPRSVCAASPTLGRVSIRLGSSLWIVSALAYFVVEAYAAAAIDGYGYASDYISTLGDPVVSPRAGLMNAAFLLQAVALPLGGWLLVRGSSSRAAVPFRIFVALNGVGNVLVATVHSGTGSPWHGVGAALAIAGGNLAVLAGAWALRPAASTKAFIAASVALGVVGLLCLLPVAATTAPIGAWERGSVYTIYGWQVLAAIAFLAAGRRRERALTQV